MASKIKINLDTSKEFFLDSKCKQNDDLTLEANIYENGLAKDLTNCSISIQALKADKTYIIQNTDIAKEKNKFIATLVKDFTRVAGKTEIEVVLTESSKQNTTFSFCLNVVGSVIKGAVESSNTVTILENLQDKIEEAGQVKAETEQLIATGGAATKGDIATINSHLEQKANEFDLEIERKRIDSFTKLSDGSTTGDAELIDARIGANGVNYDNVGSALRDLIGNINSELFYLTDEMEYGTINANTGENYDLTDGMADVVVRTKNILLLKESIEIFIPSNYKMYFYYYDSNNNFIKATNIQTNTKFVINKNTRFRYNISSIDNAHHPNDKYFFKKDILYKKIEINIINEDIKSIKNNEYKLEYTYDFGTFNYITGQYVSTNMATYSVEMLKANKNINLIIPSSFYVLVVFYDNNNTFVNSSEWVTNTKVSIRKGQNFKISCKNIPSSNLPSVNTFEKLTYEFSNEILLNKKIWWCGTSIPAGYPNASTVLPYPQRVGKKLGCTVFNVAVPSSGFTNKSTKNVTENNPYGFVGKYWDWNKMGLDTTRTEYEWLVNNYSKLSWETNAGIPLDIETNKQHYIDLYTNTFSYEKLLLPYLSTGEKGSCDVYIFDHFRNDMACFDMSEMETTKHGTTTRTNSLGAFNHLVSLIRADNPKAQIILIGHYAKHDNSIPKVDQTWKVQEYASSEFDVPMIKLYELTGINESNQKAWMPDNIHPGSDTTGECNQYLADLIANQLKLYLS